MDAVGTLSSNSGSGKLIQHRIDLEDYPRVAQHLPNLIDTAAFIGSNRRALGSSIAIRFRGVNSGHYQFLMPQGTFEFIIDLFESSNSREDCMEHKFQGETSPPPHMVIMQMLTGAWITKVLSEVTRLGVPDVLKEHGPLTATELTQRGLVVANNDALHRALRACAALGIFSEDASGKFGPTAVSELLTRSAVGSLKKLTEVKGGLAWKIWNGLPEALQTGLPQARAQLGMDFFEYLTAHPAAMEDFGEAMKANSFKVTRGLLAHYDFSGLGKVVDVGGGFGHLVVSLLERYSNLHGVLFDLPEVIAAAREQLPVRDASVAERLEYVAGDMFRDHLPFSDAFVLKMIIHDWDDPRCISVLRNCCKQLDANGRIICIDAVLPPLGDTSDAPGKLLDVNMMLVLSGKERTRAEWEALYHKAGLELRAVIPIPDTFGTCIVEGRKKLA